MAQPEYTNRRSAPDPFGHYRRPVLLLILPERKKQKRTEITSVGVRLATMCVRMQNILGRISVAGNMFY